MDPLFKAALLRILGLLLWACLSAWFFVIVEHTDKDDRNEKFQLLRSVYQSLVSKYNISIEEFNNVSSIVFEALSEPKPQWTYSTACVFVFHTLTTIGKAAYEMYFYLLDHGFFKHNTSEDDTSCLELQ